MHEFDELVYRSMPFTLNTLEEAHSKVREELITSGATRLVKNLQMFQLQRALLATGMFSLLDSILQDGLSCRNGFEEAKKILLNNKEIELHNQFNDFICAINVLKHGRGKSYDFLVAKSESLPFKIKQPGENFFFEGDVSEISTLIEVDNGFVLKCAELIEHVSKVIRHEHPYNN